MSLYVKYLDDDPFSSDDMAKLRCHIRELRDAAIERSDVLVCTPFVAGTLERLTRCNHCGRSSSIDRT